MADIFWADVPPRADSGPPRTIWSCPADGRTHDVRLVGEPVAVWLQWHEGRKRTTPCTGGGCPPSFHTIASIPLSRPPSGD
jgi:hypothetical protein